MTFGHSDQWQSHTAENLNIEKLTYVHHQCGHQHNAVLTADLQPDKRSMSEIALERFRMPPWLPQSHSRVILYETRESSVCIQ